nr:YbaN family protein [Nitratireductor kimnyeongensis]
MLGLAFIGAFLPIMPTTIFLILAAWFFARSSPTLERRLLQHPRFGPVLRDWRDRGVVPRRAKILAAVGMALGLGLCIFFYKPSMTIALTLAAAMAAVAVWIASRPEA